MKKPKSLAKKLGPNGQGLTLRFQRKRRKKQVLNIWVVQVKGLGQIEVRRNQNSWIARIAGGTQNAPSEKWHMFPDDAVRALMSVPLIWDDKKEIWLTMF